MKKSTLITAIVILIIDIAFTLVFVFSVLPTATPKTASYAVAIWFFWGLAIIMLIFNISKVFDLFFYKVYLRFGKNNRENYRMQNEVFTNSEENTIDKLKKKLYREISFTLVFVLSMLLFMLFIITLTIKVGI